MNLTCKRLKNNNKGTIVKEIQLLRAYTCKAAYIEFAHPVTTTTKSIMFQTLRKYDPLCRQNPSATTLNRASMQKIPKKYNSVSS